MLSNTNKRYLTELKARAVWMYQETSPDYEGERSVMVKVVELVGVSIPETLRRWVRQDEIDQGHRPVASEESAEIKCLKRKNVELRKANAILKAASVFLRPSLTGQGSDRRLHP